MRFSLTNAPGGFQWFLNTIFADLLDVFIVIYLDDILIYSQDEKEHVTHVSEVLQWLWKNGLYANGKKCLFHSNSVNYLGHLISPDGLKMDPDKVKVIQDWPEPQKVKDIQSFLGFANFIGIIFITIQRLLFHLPDLPGRMFPGISMIAAN